MNNFSQLIKVRRDKLQKLIDLGIDPYPERVERSHKIEALLKNQTAYVRDQKLVTITGRLDAMRRQGKVGFGNVRDETGRIQIFVKFDLVGEDNYQVFKLLDLGDFVQVRGECFVTKMGEYSIKAEHVRIICKTLRPLPTVKEKIIAGEQKRYDEFSDIELRYRKRYLDLLLNPEIKENFIIRAGIIRILRDFLHQKGFMEVETPILQPLYGGANARPFVTHHNTLDLDLYLRIALELYLKRLIIGGIEKVYEIGKTFRNEGMDRNHNPEFTMLELYQAYTDYQGMMEITEDIILKISKELFGSDRILVAEQEISFKKPWRRASMLDLIKEETGLDVSDFNFDKLKTFCEQNDIEIDPSAGPGKLIEEIFSVFVEPKLIQPTFVVDFPREISPLAKVKKDDSRLVERFELFINGNEYGNAFTELNDPLDQRERLEAQVKLRELGYLEANEIDEDFLEAMEYGMPPTGGLGIGIDRLVMLFTANSSIKEVILFPTMRPES